eukprot:NODE_19755_length_829_cov_2.495726.p1 GENE.NODE_19755_length_829_cov_2.495726~~NODE_19755_length_829_cov_2.495726.p1  ORF type:complete len:251 (+),score=49.59 NODE_19755_length_829_cov_2.495726:64-753(+)
MLRSSAAGAGWRGGSTNASTGAAACCAFVTAGAVPAICGTMRRWPRSAAVQCSASLALRVLLESGAQDVPVQALREGASRLVVGALSSRPDCDRLRRDACRVLELLEPFRVAALEPAPHSLDNAAAAAAVLIDKAAAVAPKLLDKAADWISSTYWGCNGQRSGTGASRSEALRRAPVRQILRPSSHAGGLRTAACSGSLDGSGDCPSPMRPPNALTHVASVDALAVAWR